MRKIFASLALMALATIGVAALPAAANADSTCTTNTVHLSDRPDSGFFGGDWALDTIDRTTKICQGTALNDGSGRYNYHATVSDAGTFVATKNPATGDPISATGTMTGGFTEDFTAGPMADDQNQGDGESFSGTDPASTGKWVEYVWGSEGFKGALNNDWSWTYTTKCGDATNETWVDADSNGAGDPGKGAGEITGLKCPEPSPSETKSTPTASPSTGASQPSLPVTGSSLTPIVIAGVVLLGLGIGALVIGRRRRSV